MAGMLSPMDIQGIMQNSMLNPLTQASMDMPYPEQAMIPPPPNPTAPMQGGAGMPPMPTTMQNEMIPPEIPQMPQAQAVNQMFQSEQAAPIPQAPQRMPQDPMGKWGPAFNVLQGFAAQIDDAQARANLPADLYLKMKQQTVEVENAKQDRLLKNLQMEADAKYQEQSLQIKREELALKRSELLSGGSGSSYMQDARALMDADPTLNLNDAYALARSGLSRGMTYNPATGMIEEIGGYSGVSSGIKAAEASGTEVGKEQGIAKAKLASMQASYPGLVEVTNKLNTLGKIATYTKAGQIKDEAARQLGMEIPDAAVARTAYMSTVDNEVLPLLRETFGAAFTVQEGQTLRNTLGDPDKSPDEKEAVITAFIEAKDREIKKLQRQTGETVTGGSGPVPTGIDPAILEFMTPEERALFQ